MKQPIFFTLLLLMVTTQIQPLIYQTVVMVNPVSKKTVTLYSDAHKFKQYADKKTQKKIEEINKAQEKLFTRLARCMIDSHANNDTRTVIITETSDNVLGSIVEQETGLVKTKPSEEILEILPRLFVKKITAAGASSDEKIRIFQTEKKPFGTLEVVSFLLNDTVRWIAADRKRTEKDNFLCFEVYTHWKGIKKVLDKKGQLPPELARLSIKNVEEYITALHQEFDKNHITDPYYDKILDGILHALAFKKVSENDHLALLHEYLVKSGQGTVRDEFNNNLIRFISLKFDSEIAEYLAVFEKDATLNNLLMLAGGNHNEQLQAELAAKGYHVAQTTGIDYNICSFEKQRTENDRKKWVSLFIDALIAKQPRIRLEDCGVEKIESPEKK